MTDKSSSLFDESAVLNAAARGARIDSDGDFLRRDVAARMIDRLLDINRSFADRISIGGALAGLDAREVPLSPVLDLVEGEADLILSNLVMHRVNDLVGALVQCGRALRPDGFLLVSLFGGDTLHELRTSLLRAEAEVTGRAHQRIHPMGDVRDLGGLLSRAGLALPVADTDRITVRYGDPMKLLYDLRAMGDVCTLTSRSRRFLPRSVLMRALELYRDEFSGPDGRVPATFDVIYLSAWKPDVSQQKPLAPGSGRVSLTQALKPGFSVKAGETAPGGTGSANSD